MVAFEQTCVEEKPDLVVLGDVNSTMACAFGGGFHVCHRNTKLLT
jgi:UDP-N-acetylglucosamine 2-epimerase